MTSNTRIPKILLFSIVSIFLSSSGCTGETTDSDAGTASDAGVAASYVLRSETSNFTRNQDGSGAQIIYIDRSEGFTTAVELSSAGEPSGVTVTFEPSSTEGDHAIVHFEIGATAAEGEYTVTVSGDADGDIQTVDIPLSILPATTDDFGIDASPLVATLAPGESTEVTVELQWAGEFSDDVDLECQNLPADVTCAFDSNPASAGTQTVVLTISAAAAAAEGETAILVNGTAGTQMKATGLLLSIDSSSPAFSLSSEVTNFTFNQGHNGSVLVSIERTGGHSSDITLAASGAPTGVTIGFDQNPSDTTSVIVSVEASASATTGDHTITIEGDDGTNADTTSFPIRVNQADTEDFTLAVSVLAIEIAAGSSASLDAQVQWAGGFSSSVDLACSADPAISCAFATNPVPSTETEGAVTVSVASGTSSGTYPVLLEGSGGTQNKLAAFHVKVP